MSEAARPTVIVGNWKMHKTIAEAKEFISALKPVTKNCSADVWLAVPFTAIFASSQEASGSRVAIGAQNAHDREDGAFTGEISCHMLKEAGASFVILGHSERRHLFHESSSWINKKVKRALSVGLRIIVCIGETLEEREQGLAESILEEQLDKSLSDLSDDEMEQVIIAYEPVWAIGTSQTATPDLAQEIHRYCRQLIAGRWNDAVANQVIILYGGSVKTDNAAKLLAGLDVDGLLVGGSSLSVDQFSQIICSPKAASV